MPTSATGALQVGIAAHRDQATARELRKMSESSPPGQTDATAPDDGVVVPEGFPRDPFPAALSGSQPKFSARLIDGRYVVGLTPEERKERYLACLDLVDQLMAYVRSKHAQNAGPTVAALLDNVESRIGYQGWDLGRAELDWIMKQLRARFT